MACRRRISRYIDPRNLALKTRSFGNSAIVFLARYTIACRQVRCPPRYQRLAAALDQHGEGGYRRPGPHGGGHPRLANTRAGPKHKNWFYFVLMQIYIYTCTLAVLALSPIKPYIPSNTTELAYEALHHKECCTADSAGGGGRSPERCVCGAHRGEGQCVGGSEGGPA